MSERDEAAALLPLPPATFHILVALAEDDRHGYGIMQDVAAGTGGELRLSAGTLYRSIQRMVEQGLIVEVRHRPQPHVQRSQRSALPGRIAGGSPGRDALDDVKRGAESAAFGQEDERRRYYRITSFGTTVARAEAGRLAGLVKLARAAGLVPGKA